MGLASGFPQAEIVTFEAQDIVGHRSPPPAVYGNIGELFAVKIVLVKIVTFATQVQIYLLKLLNRLGQLIFPSKNRYIRNPSSNLLSKVSK